MPLLDRFSPATRAWFSGAFAEPTAAQLGAWEAIGDGRDTLVVAPTGSGKTLAAFLWSIDSLTSRPAPADAQRRCRVVYVSPLKALAVDVERNLRSPLTGIRQAARRLGLDEPSVDVAMRTGDTTAAERRLFARKPPDILITTPESLFLLLTSAARAVLAGVDTVIVDEIHAIAGSKRGAHLAVTLERLDALAGRRAQRIGLSATVRPVDEVARFLGGSQAVSAVQPATAKTVDVSVVVPVEDMADPLPTATPDDEAPLAPPPSGGSIWPAIEERIVDLVAQHRSTIVFANSRRLAERLTARINEVAAARAAEPLPDSGAPPAQLMAQAGSTRGAPAVIARAHHGSVSREQRKEIEEALKRGDLPAVVATSSLELGIDMGAVDLVVQVESPPSVASGLQRIGRAGHHVGAVSRGVVFPKFRGDLVQSAVVAQRMRHGEIESLSVPRNPLDVLAQQVVAMVAMDDWTVDDIARVVRRAAPFATLPDSALEATLDMLAGRYPSDEFAELRPRIVWDRVGGRLTARPGAQRLAVTSGGTIPDRGLFGVFLVGEHASRVGELDEEMVYESRVGDVFTLGTSSWRIEDITHDRVLVSPAPGQPGKLPFWHGDALGRPVELGRAVGAFVRELSRLDSADAVDRCFEAGLDELAARNLISYLAEQRTATGHIPDDRTIVVERFRDELGDWRVAIHSPFGARVHAPWALAIAARLRERSGLDVQAMHADDGIVLRLPDTESDPPDDLCLLDPGDVDGLVRDEVGGSSLFASRFRECAARALLLPRRQPGRRTPLWQQRQRSAHLLGVASRYPTFPIVLETMRECLQDVFDVPGLVALMRDIEARRVRVVTVETPLPSPFARSLLFGYVAAFLYEGDAPLAERRAAALTVDTTLLAELLGTADLRELLDAGAIDELERELQRLAPDRQVDGVEGVAELLRLVGDLSTAEALLRGATPHDLEALEAHRRALRVRIAGEERWIAIEDAGRVRDALGVALPVGVPEAFTEPVSDPLGDIVARFARTHGPFVVGDVARRYSLGVAVVTGALERLQSVHRAVHGEFRPGGSGVEWCDTDILRRLRRRSLARLRHEVEAVAPEALGRFLPAWQGLGGDASSGIDALLRAVEQLDGAAVPASTLESLVLPARVTDYQPAMLDELCASGEVVWSGAGALPGDDGWVCLGLAETAPLLLPSRDDAALATPVHRAVLEVLASDHAVFFRTLAEALQRDLDAGDDTVAAALWDLVWAGHVSNDTLAPLRARLGGNGRRVSRSPSRSRGRRVRPTGLRAGPRLSTPPATAGRWWRLPEPLADPTRRAHALAESLLDRHGVVTRSGVAAERVPGGYAAVYPVLRTLEEAGRIRRGYFVEGLGAAQFAAPGAVDRLRSVASVTSAARVDHPLGRDGASARCLVLSATDPANPYGAALSWPDRPLDSAAAGHRPGRKAGALVVLVDGLLVIYVERGGRSLLTFSDDVDRLRPAVDALALAVHEGMLGSLAVERADGEAVATTALGEALRGAGFHATPRGLRLRS